MNLEPAVLDLFSGIGGFSLGLERAGMKTVAFCEIEEFPRKVLNKNFPGVPIYDDIRKLTAERLRQDGIGPIDVVCGGFPCQPFSQAGKQGGFADDRDLWPEMFRIIQEVRPRWVIGENVAGFVNMGLERTIADLESEAYEVQPIIIPACAVGAPHQRARVWIVAYRQNAGAIGRYRIKRNGQSQSGIRRDRGTGSTGNDGCETLPNTPRERCGEAGAGVERSEERPAGGPQIVDDPKSRGRGFWNTSDIRPGQGNVNALRDSGQNVSDSGRSRVHERRKFKTAGGGSEDVENARCSDGKTRKPNRMGNGKQGEGLQAPLPSRRPVEPGVGGGPHGISKWLDGSWEDGIPRIAGKIPNRVGRLKGLGNAVVPQVVEALGRAIMEIEH